ncbi:MAG TPA: hypothetical protein VIE17_11705, partial [Methylophilaceae bacterium]
MKFVSASLLALTLFTPLVSNACSSCGCTLNSDWSAQGVSAGEGLHFDIRADYFKQNQMRHGTDSVSRTSVPAGTEVQENTINRNLSLAVDYSFNADWAVNVMLPVYSRTHSTFGDGSSGFAYPDPNALQTSSSQGIGDIKVTTRYSGFSADHSFGIIAGLKLPTGETKDTFSDGSELDRGLQLGSGTTDLLIGGYHFGTINRDWDYFSQAVLQLPLDSHDDFRPGDGLNVTAGVRYMSFDNFIPQLQVNARMEKRESGGQADVENSGATLVYLSPGVTVPISKQVLLYGFLQIPIFQRVNGYQIETQAVASVGLHY